MLTLCSASPRPISFFVWTLLASYGAVGQKESWMPLASCGAERVNEIASLAISDNFGVIRSHEATT